MNALASSFLYGYGLVYNTSLNRISSKCGQIDCDSRTGFLIPEMFCPRVVLHIFEYFKM